MEGILIYLNNQILKIVEFNFLGEELEYKESSHHYTLIMLTMHPYKVVQHLYISGNSPAALSSKLHKLKLFFSSKTLEEIL